MDSPGIGTLEAEYCPDDTGDPPPAYLALSECQLAPPSPQLGDLDPPPSPPPLPLVSESVALETRDEFLMEMAPSVYQVTDKPPLMKPQNFHQKPDQLIEVCKIEVETVPLVSGTAETDPRGEEQIETRQMGLNYSENEVSDGSTAEMAPQGSVPKNLETQAPSGSDTDTLVSIQDTPSGAGDTAASSARGDFRHIKAQEDQAKPMKKQETPQQGPILQNTSKESPGMSSRTPGCVSKMNQMGSAQVGPSQHALEEPQENGPQHFTSLLWMAPSQHKTSIISKHPSEIITVRHQHPAIPYHPLCELALKKLGLFQISQMQQFSVDRFLIAALVERWRPETHTFHMPVGEMTVTLQDVSCLWGLPIQGDPVTGESDAMWGPIIEEYLGIPISEQGMKHKIREKKDSEDVVITNPRYSIRLPMLRERFHVMPDNPTQAQIDHYTRAFVLDLFGSVIFPGASDRVPAMYLQFLKNLEEPQQYSWGAAALAVLYRGLCFGAETNTKQIAGPVLLLQQWSWTRFTVGRPIDRDNIPPKWGTPDLESCPPYGAKWCTRHLSPSTPRNAGVQLYRNKFDQVREGWVTWNPYDQVMHLMPMRVQNDRTFWLARIPLIHFWAIEYHYPDRVMRQFSLFQIVPPPLPDKEDEVCRLHKIKHVCLEAYDWSVIHCNYVQQYYDSAQRMVIEDRPYNPNNLIAYRQWFQREGMYTVFLEGHYEAGLDEPIPIPRDTVEPQFGYVPSGSAIARIALRSIKLVAWGIKLQLARGWKNRGKFLLQIGHGNLEDLNMECRVQEMLKEAGLPPKIDELPSDESTPACSTPMPQPPYEMNVHVMDDWLYSGRGFTRYLNAGLDIGEGN